MKDCFRINASIANLLTAAANGLCLVALVIVSDGIDLQVCLLNSKMESNTSIKGGSDIPYVFSFDMARSLCDFEYGLFSYCVQEQAHT